MRTAAVLLAVVVGVALVVGGCASKPADVKSASKQQMTCPVSGGPINKDVHLDYKGKRIYFCCTACPVVFQKDPEKYMKQMADEGIVLENTPTPK